MSEQLPAPGFDSQPYERPNHKWICGRAAEGRACRSGPDGSGHCGAGPECAPILEVKPGETKGRWRCTRAGGACEAGPLPDGACSRRIPKCSPFPTLRAQRGRFTRAVVTATVALLLILFGTPRLRTRFINHGEISSPHASAAFAKLAGKANQTEPTCAACHKAGAAGPIDLVKAAFHASPGPLELNKLTQAQPAAMTAIDESCQKCHTQHLFHQANVVRDMSCSACHAEHQGVARIAAPTATQCAFCHGNVNTMTAAATKGAALPAEAFHPRGVRSPAAFEAARPAAGFTQVIQQFAGDHPEFRVHTDGWRDPDTLKFGHALHLTSQTIPKLPNGERLGCAFCHRVDAAGIYFRPVTFEGSCRVCHSLQFDAETPGLTLPHGAPASVSAFLHSLPKQYADYAARTGITADSEQKRFVEQKLARLQGQVVSGEELEQRAFFSTALMGPSVQVGTAGGTARAVYPGCAYCHEVKSTPAGGPQITKPVLVERWLSHAEFNHVKHSKMICSQCHQAEQSKATADIILPGKAVCATCHSPAGGVADSCATCHVYHTARR